MSPDCAATTGLSGDPKGLPIEEVRAIRDEVKRRVEALLKREQL